MVSGIKELDSFVKVELTERVERAYAEHLILSEADLAAFVWSELRDFTRELESRHPGSGFTVHCQPYLKDLHIHPDVMVFRKGKPWVAIELKERKEAEPDCGLKDARRLLECKRQLNVKKGYLIYLARRWRGAPGKLVKGGKQDGKRFLFEIPIVMEELLPDDQDFAEWEATFRERARYFGKAS